MLAGSRVTTIAVGSLTIIAVLAGCSSAAPTSTAPNLQATVPVPTATPDLQALLRAPVGQPVHCHGADGVTTGRSSPWGNTVDVSVFVSPTDSAKLVRQIGTEIRDQPQVGTVYFESQHDAYREFQRLYTCSGDLTPGGTPASYRIVLAPGSTYQQRDALVIKEQLTKGVDVVSCQAAVSCEDIVDAIDPKIQNASPPRSAQPGVSSPTPTSTSTTLPSGASGQAHASS